MTSIKEGDDADEVTDAEILEAVTRAISRYRFCPNRVWAIAGSLEDKERGLPYMFPSLDWRLEKMFALADNGRTKDDEHARCTFDFCERSQLNSTSISQRHESPSCLNLPCDGLQDLFPADVLNAVAKAGSSTAWKLGGRRSVDEGTDKFMAISHVWSDGTGAGSNPGRGVNRCLFNFFRDMARHLGCNGLWWDTICIPTEKIARANAINKMHENYSGAHVTLVHDCFLRGLEWIDDETASLAIIMSPWFSRGWTALELACSRTVKVLFKGQDGPVVKDLDLDILESPGSRRHKLITKVIQHLRQNRVRSLDQLLGILGLRYTSWARDMAIIAGLLVGVDFEQETYQQDIYQRILKQIGQVGYRHLFHNLPTVSSGTSWCPSKLLSLPLDSSNQMLSIDQDGSVVGVWKVISIDQAISYSWSDAHPLVAVKLRASLQDKAHHVLLAEPTVEHVTQALLVRVLDSTGEGKRCQFVGCLHLELSGEEGLSRPEETVRLINNANETSAGSEVQWNGNWDRNEASNRGCQQLRPMCTDLTKQEFPTRSLTASSNTNPPPDEGVVSFEKSMRTTHVI